MLRALHRSPPQEGPDRREYHDRLSVRAAQRARDVAQALVDRVHHPAQDLPLGLADARAARDIARGGLQQAQTLK